MSNAIDAQIIDMAKKFFRLGELPSEVCIVLPAIDHSRKNILHCINYPKYNYAMAPDDVYTAMTVHSVLSSIYGPEKIRVTSSREPSFSSCHKVLIGGASTNDISALAAQDKYFHYDENDGHIIVSESLDKKKYSVSYDNDCIPESKRKIIKDYAFISSFGGESVGWSELILSGCRAYGQLAFKDLLFDPGFYDTISNLVGNSNYQVILPIKVVNKTPIWIRGKIEDYKIYKKHVFLSSTLRDLKDYRHSIIEELKKLGLEPICMEEFGANTNPPVELVKKRVLESNIYLGILGRQYGSIEEVSGLSFTEIEYNTAKENNKEIFIYIMNDEILSSGNNIEQDSNKLDKFNKFKKKIEKNHCIYKFKDKNDLVDRVRKDLELYFKNGK